MDHNAYAMLAIYCTLCSDARRGPGRQRQVKWRRYKKEDGQCKRECVSAGEREGSESRAARSNMRQSKSDAEMEMLDYGLRCSVLIGLVLCIPLSGKPTFYFFMLFHAFLCFLCFLKEKK